MVEPVIGGIGCSAFAMFAVMIIFDDYITDRNLWVVAVVGVVAFLVGGLSPDSYDARREENAEVMEHKGALNRRIENEAWKRKGGKADDGTMARLERELKEYESGLEIAPGDGVFWRKKRK